MKVPMPVVCGESIEGIAVDAPKHLLSPSIVSSPSKTSTYDPKI